MRKNPRPGKKIAMFDLEGNFIKHFKDAYEAEKEVGLSDHRIREACRNKWRQTAGGHIFRYVHSNEVTSLTRLCNCCGKLVDSRDLVLISLECMRRFKGGDYN